MNAPTFATVFQLSLPQHGPLFLTSKIELNDLYPNLKKGELRASYLNGDRVLSIGTTNETVTLHEWNEVGDVAGISKFNRELNRSKVKLEVLSKFFKKTLINT